MLTAKHIGIAGSETIYLGHEITFQPRKEASECLTRSPIEAETAGGVVTVLRENRVPIGLCGGTVFVMNDLGKTIARYDLGASPVPIVGDNLHDPRQVA